MSEWEASTKSMHCQVKNAAKIKLDLNGMRPINNRDGIPEDLSRICQLPLATATVVLQQNPADCFVYCNTGDWVGEI